MKIQAKAKKDGATAVFEYNEKGLLKSVTFCKMSQAQMIWVGERLPQHVSVLKLWKEKFAKLFTFSEVAEDLSFDSFWNRYAYKVGNKTQAKKLWEKLKDEEKTAVMKSIAKYENFLRNHPGQAKAYPTTFLNQRRWENEF